jgi:hypothetical protein
LWGVDRKRVALTFGILCPSQNFVIGVKWSPYPATKVGQLNVNNIINARQKTFLLIKLIYV